MILQSGTSLSPGMVQKYGKYFAYKVGEIVSPDFGSSNSSSDLLNLLLDVPARMFRDFEVEVSNMHSFLIVTVSTIFYMYHRKS